MDSIMYNSFVISKKLREEIEREKEREQPPFLVFQKILRAGSRKLGTCTGISLFHCKQFGMPKTKNAC